MAMTLPNPEFSDSFMLHPSAGTASTTYLSPTNSSSMLVHPQIDSGIFDVGEPEDLLRWQDCILQIWYDNNRHKPSDSDIEGLAKILKASEDQIKARLCQFFESEKRGNYPIRNRLPRNTADFHNHSDLAPRFLSGYNHSIGAQAPIMEERITPRFTGPTSPSAEASTRPSFASEPFSRPVLECDSSESLSTSITMSGVSNDNSGNNSYISSLGLTSGSNSSSFIPQASSFVGQPVFASDVGSASQTVLQGTPNMNIYSLMPAAAANTEPMVPVPVRMTESLYAAIMRMFETRKAQGCKSIRSNEVQKGIYKCTIKCRRRFKTACDLFRHEATVFPQEAWFCTRCGDLDNASERHLFTREDKFRSHNKIVHKDTGPVMDYKVPNFPRAFPDRCGLCTHQHHRSWRDRCKHIIWHYQKGHHIPRLLSRRSGPYGVDDEDDSDSDNDGDGDGGDNDDDDKQTRGHSNPPAGGSRGDGAGGDDLPPPGPNSGGDPDSNEPQNGENDFSEFIDWQDFSFRNHRANVTLHDVPKSKVPQTDRGANLIDRLCFGAPADPKITIQWKERVNQKGGTATVFKVSASSASGADAESISQLCVVKQYRSNNVRLFEKERRAFEILTQNGEQHPNMVRFFGWFIHHDPAGARTFNLLLEDAECDMEEYFADRNPPTLVPDIKIFWDQMLGLADGLRSIHEQDGYIGWHADIKPDNILYANGRFKMADFGLSKFVPLQTDSSAQATMDGGTAIYSAPELTLRPGQTTLPPVDRSVDVWSFGCLLAQAATWVVSGFNGLRDFEALRRTGMTPHGCGSATARFHDGERVLPEVTSWFEHLRANLRRADKTTGLVLDLVRDHLLQGDPSLRYDSKQLCEHLEGILKKEHAPREQFPIDHSEFGTYPQVPELPPWEIAELPPCDFVATMNAVDVFPEDFSAETFAGGRVHPARAFDPDPVKLGEYMPKYSPFPFYAGMDFLFYAGMDFLWNDLESLQNTSVSVFTSEPETLHHGSEEPCIPLGPTYHATEPFSLPSSTMRYALRNLCSSFTPVVVIPVTPMKKECTACKLVRHIGTIDAYLRIHQPPKLQNMSGSTSDLRIGTQAAGVYQTSPGNVAVDTPVNGSPTSSVDCESGQNYPSPTTSDLLHEKRDAILMTSHNDARFWRKQTDRHDLQSGATLKDYDEDTQTEKRKWEEFSSSKSAFNPESGQDEDENYSVSPAMVGINHGTDAQTQRTFEHLASLPQLPTIAQSQISLLPRSKEDERNTTVCSRCLRSKVGAVPATVRSPSFKRPLVQALDRYLHGRQETKTIIRILTDGHLGSDELHVLQELLSQFQNSRLRRPGKDNLIIRFVIGGDSSCVDDGIKQLREEYSFVSVTYVAGSVSAYQSRVHVVQAVFTSASVTTAFSCSICAEPHKRRHESEHACEACGIFVGRNKLRHGYREARQISGINPGRNKLRHDYRKASQFCGLRAVRRHKDGISLPMAKHTSKIGKRYRARTTPGCPVCGQKDWYCGGCGQKRLLVLLLMRLRALCCCHGRDGG